MLKLVLLHANWEVVPVVLVSLVTESSAASAGASMPTTISLLQESSL